MHRRVGIAAMWVVMLRFSTLAAGASISFNEDKLVSDIPGLATFTDASLKNPWGISASATSPFWVSDQATGLSTLYNGAGVKNTQVIVSIPTGSPTGQVSNGTNDFLLANGNGAKASFIFSTLTGTIAAWNGGTTALTEATGTNATYTGLALANNGTGNFLYAANARGGANNGIDIYNSSFGSANASFGANAFKVTNLPAGLTPYNIANLNGTLYVTYSERNQPTGFVAAFDTNGNFLRGYGLNAPPGVFDAPWGLAIAPASFGAFANSLLVGNFGDPGNGAESGTINAFDPNTGIFLGQLTKADGTPFKEPGLWGLIPGNTGAGSDPSKLYFTAGINNQVDGLFGVLSAVPEPSSALQGVIAILFTSFVYVIERRPGASGRRRPVPGPIRRADGPRSIIRGGGRRSPPGRRPVPAPPMRHAPVRSRRTLHGSADANATVMRSRGGTPREATAFHARSRLSEGGAGSGEGEDPGDADAHQDQAGRLGDRDRVVEREAREVRARVQARVPGERRKAGADPEDHGRGAAAGGRDAVERREPGGEPLVLGERIGGRAEDTLVRIGRERREGIRRCPPQRPHHGVARDLVRAREMGEPVRGLGCVEGDCAGDREVLQDRDPERGTVRGRRARQQGREDQVVDLDRAAGGGVREDERPRDALGARHGGGEGDRDRLALRDRGDAGGDRGSPQRRDQCAVAR
jgi:uncharacterized protein (TIGR03118 family)